MRTKRTSADHSEFRAAYCITPRAASISIRADVPRGRPPRLRPRQSAGLALFLYGLEIEFADPLQKHEHSGLLTSVGDPVRPPRLNLKYVALSQQHFLIRLLHCNANVAFKNEEAITHVGMEMPRHFLSRPNPRIACLRA
jgi:hypothetical protein